MSRRRIFLICIAVFLLLGAGVLWILNVEGIFQALWSNIFASIFAILGVLFAFFQWVLPLPILESKPSDALSADDRAYATYLKQVETGLTEGTGAIVIHTLGVPETLRNGIAATLEDSDDLFIYEYMTWKDDRIGAHINLHTINGHPIYAATIIDLKPGNYFVGLPATDPEYKYFSRVTVLPKQVAEVDWRFRPKLSF